MAPVAGRSSDEESPVTPRPAGHYFSPSPDAASRPGRVPLVLPDRTLSLATDAGVFSPGRVDPGTKLLLTELPELTAGPVVDLGCGYGPIACTVALRHPELSVVAVDVNARARALCAANARELGVHVDVRDPADCDDLPPIATIVANPPIRIGKAALHQLLGDWFDRLVPGGRAYLVVHKNLGADSLTRWLTEQGHQVDRLRSRQGYRVLQVVRG